MISISVIIPTYCPQSYFRESLNSLLNQKDCNFDVIIVLNGPKEPYLTKIKQWISELKIFNVTILYSPEKGVSAARNLALDNNKSDYVVFLDDDDLINPDYLKSLYQHADDSCVVAAAVVNFQNNDTTVTTPDYLGREFLEKNIAECSPQQCPSVFSSCCGKLIPTFLIGNNRFNQKLPLGEDSLFMFQLLCMGISKVIYVPEAVYRRRVRHNSASRKKYAFKTILINRLKLLHLYTVCYFSNLFRISPIFYVRRICAVLKGFFYLIHQK